VTDQRRDLDLEVDAAMRLSAVESILQAVLNGETGIEASDKLPHVVLMDLHRQATIQKRQLIEEAILGMLKQLASRDAQWRDDAAVAVLLASRGVCAYRCNDALAQITRILRSPERYSERIAIAAGQAALMMGYLGNRAVWQALHDRTGIRGVPVVLGGLARSDWHALIAWLPRVLDDAYAERTFLNGLSTLAKTHTMEELAALVTGVCDAISERGRAEALAFIARHGVVATEDRSGLAVYVNGALYQLLESLRSAVRTTPKLTTTLRGHFQAASHYLDQIVNLSDADQRLKDAYFDCHAQFAVFEELQSLDELMPTGDAICSWVIDKSDEQGYAR
jgi:hypothetical protein